MHPAAKPDATEFFVQDFIHHARSLFPLFYSVLMGALFKILVTDITLPYSSPLLSASQPSALTRSLDHPLPIFAVFLYFLISDWFLGWFGWQRISRNAGQRFWQPFTAAIVQVFGVLLLGLAGAMALQGTPGASKFASNPYLFLGFYSVISSLWVYLVLIKTPLSPLDEIKELILITFWRFGNKVDLMLRAYARLIRALLFERIKRLAEKRTRSWRDLVGILFCSIAGLVLPSVLRVGSRLMGLAVKVLSVLLGVWMVGWDLAVMPLLGVVLCVQPAHARNITVLVAFLVMRSVNFALSVVFVSVPGARQRVWATG